MRFMRTRTRAAVAGVLAGVLAGALAAAGVRAEEAPGQIVVVANPNVGEIELTREVVRDIYRGEVTFLGHVTLSPISLHEYNPLAQAFLAEVLGMTENQFKSWWIKRIFRYGDVPPMRVLGSADMISRVLTTPGGIGYLSADDLPPGTPLSVLWRFTPEKAYR
jgi:hypothetical protein